MISNNLSARRTSGRTQRRRKADERRRRRSKVRRQIEILEDRSLLSGASLDPSFSGDGRLVTDFVGDHDIGNAVAVQLDELGRIASIVAVGSAAGDFGIARYLGDGSLDTEFGQDLERQFACLRRAYANRPRI